MLWSLSQEVSRKAELQSSESGSNINRISKGLEFQSGVAITELIRTEETNRAGLPRASSLLVEMTEWFRQSAETCQCLDNWLTSKKDRRRYLQFLLYLNQPPLCQRLWIFNLLPYRHPEGWDWERFSSNRSSADMAELVLGGALQGRRKEGDDYFASQMCDIYHHFQW